MKRHLQLLMLLAAFLVPWATNAQTTVTIGTGNTTSREVPINNYYNYSINEMLYTAEEIGTAGTISSISFYYNGAAKDFPITVYMQNVDASNLSTGISLATADQVFAGTYSVTATEGWHTITLDSPFAYDGTSNLLIGINKGYLYYYSTYPWHCTSTSSTMARYSANDNNGYTTSTVPGSTSSVRPNIQIAITPGAGPSCQRPESLTVTSITTNTAYLNWTGGSGAFNVEYKLASADTWTRAASNIGWNYMLVNLTPATTYDVRVQSVCSDTVSAWRTASFTTACGAITSFPWSENFESYSAGDFSAPCWVNQHITGSGTNVFKISTSSLGVNSTHQLQLPDMNIGTQTMLRLPGMTLNGNYQFVLDINRSSSTYSTSYAEEGIRVFASADGTLENATEITFIPRNYDVSSSLIPAEDETGWYTYTLPIPITTGTCYIILRGESQYCTPTYMDNFVVEQAPSCPAPIMVTVNYTGGTTATVSWNSDATAFNLDVNGTVIPVTTNPYTLTGLSLATTYTLSVQANCGNGDTSTWTNPVSFTTDFCMPADQCNITITLTDAFGDGGGQIQVVDSLTNTVLATYINDSEDDNGGDSATYTLVVCNGRTLNFVFTATDAWPHENGWVITNANGDTIAYREGCESSNNCSTPANGVFASYTVNCAGLCVPMLSEIGDSAATTSSYMYPVNNNYRYSLSETIIDASEIGGPMDINSISYYYTGATASTAKTNCTIYVQPTTKTVFSSISDLELLDPENAVMVYTGSLNCSQGWNTFTFTTPFNYDGVGNLMVIIDDNSNGWDGSNCPFRITSCTDHKTLYWYSDTQNPDPTSSSYSGSKNYAQYRVVMKLDGCQGTAASCMVPTALAVTPGSSNATLTWVDSAAAPLYGVTLSNASGTVSYATTTTPSYTLTGLTPNSDYTVAVRALCSASDSSRAVAAAFHTECGLMTALPYSYGFEDAATGSSSSADFGADCWKRLNNGTSSYGYPYISSSSSYCHTGSRGLYWNRSTTASYGDYQILALPGVGGSYVMSGLRVKFWAKASSASYRPVFYVGVMTDPTDASTFVYVDTVNVNTDGNTNWAEYTGSLAGYTGTGRYVAIRADRASTTATWTAYFDDVTLQEIPSCVEVSNLVASNITTSSATLTWSDLQNTGATYTVIGPDGVVASGITGTTYTVTGLNASTGYTFNVVANCSATDSSYSTSVTFRTACGLVTMPWSEDFDSWTAKSDCWSYLSGAFNNGAGTPTASTSAWTLSNSYGDYITLSGKALAMNIYSTNRYWAVTPAISISSNNAQLTFDIAVAAWSSATPNYDANDTLAVAISTNGGASYTPLLVYDNTQLNALSGTYTTVTVPVTGYNGQNVRFAIFGGSSASGGDNRVVIDNVSIDEAPCVPMLSEIGDSTATTTTYNYPVNNYFNYTLSETIIDASEIGGPMDINNISFYYNYATAMTNKSNCTIYVQPTSKTVFSSNSDIELLDPVNAVMVYTGDLNCSQGWNTFTFTTPFHYDGVGNLMVIVDDNSGSYNSSSYTFRTSACTGYKTLHWYSDSQNPDPTSSTYSGTKSYTQNRVVMKLDGCQGTAASCMVPTALAVTPGINNATLTWVDSAAAPLYSVTLSDASGVVSYATTTTPSYTLTGLTPSSDYTVAVRALCSASDSSRAVAAAFHTECDLMTTLPYSYGFEGATTGGSTNPDFAADCWKRLNNGTSNMGYPYISSSSNACHTGTRGLYWYNYSTVSSYGNYRVIVLPGVGGNYNIDDLRLSFWASCTASFRPVFYVGVMTDPTDISTFTVVDTVNVNTAGTTGSWTQYFAPLANYTGTGRYVAIASYPEGSTWTAYVDDVTLEIAPSCLEVSNLAATATHNSATLTWADQNNTNATYTVSDATNVIASGITGTTYTVTGLTANTSYTFYVTANCSATEASSPVSVNVTTTCAPESYPYAENFDSWTAKSACWSFLSGAFNNGAGTPTANTSAWDLLSNSYGEDITISGKALIMNLYSTYQYWAVTPAISITSNTAQLTFDIAVAGWSSATPNFDANDTMAVAISTNGGASYTPLLVYDNTQLNALSGTYTTVTVPVTGYNGQNVRFAIFAGSTASGGDNRVVIDNVSIDEAPSCPAPEITIDSVVGRTVWFHWTSTGDSVFLTLVNSEGDQMWGQFTISNGSVGAAGFYLPEQYFPTGYTYLYGLSFCGTSETTSDTSAWGVESFPVSCDAEYQCPVTFVLNDGYGDGWNGGELLIYDSITGMTCANMAANNHGLDDMPTSDTVVYNLCGDRTYQVYIAPGQYTDEISFQILDNNGNVLWSQALGTITSSSDTLGYFHLGTCATEPECVPMVSEIGDSTSTTTSYYTPVNNYFNYSLSETIIDAAEIGGPMTINTISYYFNYASPMTSKTNCTIYLQPTSKSVFASSSDIDLLDPASAVMVYTGDLNCVQGWNTFTLTTPYYYDGQDNLMVIVDDNSGSYNGSSYTFRTSACTGYKTLYWYSDSYNPDPTNGTFSGSKGYLQSRVVMNLDGCQAPAATCIKPTTIAETHGVNNATVTWSGNAYTYSVTLMDATGAVLSYATTIDSNYTFTGLTGNTDYNVAVRALCSDADSSSAKSISFHTECDLMVSLPYTYGFEDAATGSSSNAVFTVECWKRHNNATGSYQYPYVSSSNTHAGSRSLYWYSSTSTTATYGTYQMVALPGLGGNYAMSDLRLKFWSKVTTATYRPVFYVGVMTDPNDYTTFVATDTIAVNTDGNTNYAEYIANLTGYTGTGRYVAIVAQRPASSLWYAYMDDITLEVAPTCLEPTDVTVDNITTNSAVVSWTGTANGYTVAYGTGTNPDAMTTVSATGTSTTLTGLTPNTAYNVYVKAVCSATDQSPWTNATTFRTNCAAFTAPYAWTFEEMATSAAPECWTKVGSGTANVTSSTSASHNSTKYLRFSGSTSNLILLPEMASAVNTLRMRLWTRPESTTNSSCGTFSVGYVTDASDASTFVALETYTYNSFSDYEEKTVVFASAPAGARMALRHNPTSTSWYWYVDDVTVEEIPSCEAPSITDVTYAPYNNGEGDYAATVSWENTGALAYEVCWIEPSLTRIFSNGNDTVHAFVIHPDEASYVKVRAICGAGDTSAWSDSVRLYYGYCTPTPTSVDNNGVTSVAFGGMANTTSHAGNTAAYVNNRAMVGTVPAGTTATVNITYATGYDYGTIIWVDWNKNYVFDTNEVVAVGTSQETNPTTLALSFLIPATQDTGDYCMRIVGADSYFDSYVGSIAAAANANPCASYSWGIAEDYTLHVSPAPSCLPVSNVTIGTVTNTTIDVSFTTSGAPSYDVYALTSTSATAALVNTTTGNATLTGLTSGTTYYVRVQASCGDGVYSILSEPIAVTTAFCDTTSQCPVTVILTDGYGDGWNGGLLTIFDSIANVAVATLAANDHGGGDVESNDTVLVNLCVGRVYGVSYASGQYDSEVSFRIIASDGTTQSNITYPVAGTLGYFTHSCTATPQEECWPMPLVIGNENSTTTSYYTPVNNYYNYTLSETIIDQAEIGGAMPINGIRYYFNYASPMTSKTNCTIYLQPTTKTAFSSSSDLEMLSDNAVMVYTGALNCSQGWNEFTFDTPYQYDGTSNLMVIVDDNSGSYNTSSHLFRTSACTGYKTLYWYSDSYNPDPANSTFSGSKGYLQSRVVMALVTCDTATCHAPVVAEATTVGANNATVVWTSSNAAAYSVTLMSGSSVVSYNTTVDTTYTFTGLTANTDYSVVIRGLCSANDSSSAVTADFHTECDLMTTLPYTYGFEGAATGSSTNVVFDAECWHRHNNGTTYFGYPYISSSTTYCHSGSRGLYWYNYSTVSTYGNYRVIVLPGLGGNYTMSDLRLKFWAKASTASYRPVFHVGVMTDPTDISTLDTVYTVTTNTAGNTDWAEYSAYLAGYTGTGRYVAIATYPEGATWTAYVDDVTLEEAPSCTEVTNLAVAGVTSSSVTLTWTDALNTTGTTYTVSDAQGTTIASGITGTTYTVTGLTANTSYTFSVVANCSATEASGTMSVTAHTECDLMATLPYTYGFEGAATGGSTNAVFDAECWKRLNNGTTYFGYPYISSSAYHTGSRGLYWYNYNTASTYGNYRVAVLPGLGGNYTMSDLRISFWAKASTASYRPVFHVGVMTDPTDISTLDTVYTVNVNTAGTTDWAEYTAYLAGYTGTGRYVAIASYPEGTSWTAYVDDVTLEEVSGCQPVTNLAATVADNSVTLTWSDPLNTGATYTVIGANGTIATGITTTSYTVTGLTPNTAYNFSVVANCSADVASDSASIAVQTACTFLATLPYTMGFEADEGVSTGSSTSTTFIDCWHRLNNGTQYFGYPYVSTTSSYIHTGARGLYWANSTTTGTYGDYQCIVLPGLGGNYAMDGLQLKFWARATGTSYHPVLYVGVMTDPTDINSFVYVDTINVEGTTYTEYTSYLNNYTGTGRYVAIRANRPASAWYLTMDDITLDVMPSCFPVTNLTIASTTTSSMTLAWNDNFNDGATYTVSNAQGVIASNVTGTSYTVTGLNAGTEYTFMVTSNCSATDSGETVSVTGYTACATLTAADLPYTEDFEAYGSGSAYSISPCWTKGTNGSTAYPYPTSTAASGTRSLYFYGYKPSSTTGTHVYSYAALPQLDATLDASDLTLSFKARRYSTVSVSYRSIIYVGVMTNPTDASTFVAVDTINMTPLPASTIETYNVILANYTGTGKYVAFYCPWVDTNTSYSYNYIYIDDVMLDITPTCLPVADITATNATTNSVTLSWTDAYNTGATYTVYDMSDSTVMGTGITGTTYTVTGLAASSSYTFGIQANCSANDASPIMTVATRTACGVATMPWVENFDGWTAKSDCWAFLSGAFNGGAGTPTANTSAWSLSNSYGDYITISGKALAMNIYSTNRYWAVTPAISISSNNAQLTFDIAVAAWSASTPNYDANDTLAIAVTTDSGLTYTPLLVYDNTQLNALSNNYTMVTVPLTGYSGQDVRIAFFGGSSASGGDNRVVIDNVSVTEATLDSTVFMLAVNDTTMGTVLPHLGTNTYNAGDSVIITAVPNTGYLFDYWVASMDNGDTMHLATNPLRNVVTTGDAGHTYHVTAMFKCDAVAFPFSENFESGVLSNCWTVDGPGTWTVGTGDYTLSTGAHTGTYNAKINHSSSGNVTKLITPAIDFTGVTAAELRFWHLQRAWSGDQDELRVYYRTSATAAWQQLAAYTNEITAYTEEAIQLPNLSSTYQVAFEFTDGYGYGVALDDITINVPPTCTAVTALTATPTDSSVVLTWTDANTSATYTVYDMSDSTVIATGITATTYTVTGLNANTLYTFGVVANCSATDASQFTTVTVRTNCSVFTAPYTWTFEDMDAGAAPLCWTKVGSGNANVTSSTSYAHNSTKYLRFSGSTSNLIVLPEINGTLSDLQMRLWTRPESTSNSSCGTFSVGYVTDVNDATTFVALETYSYNDFTAYDQKTVRYNGVPTGARMALRHTPTSTSWYWYVDDVTVEEIPSCMPVTDVAVTGVTFNSVSLLWNSVDGAASYIIYDMSDTSVIAATVTDTFYTVTGLTAETNYTFGVKSRCSATDVTPMFATVDAYTGYCIPTPTSVDGSGITSVAFGSLTNDAARPSGAGYRNYSNMSGMVATGSPVTVDITYATGYTYGTIIWVDWNNSMTFESNEVVYVGTSTNTNPTTLTCTFNIPADQALGSYRMRILGADSYFDSYTGSIAAAAGANPCASYSWGVAEDYTLTLVTPSVCPNVAGFTVTGVTNNSVSLSWNTVTGATYTLYNGTNVVATGITDTVYTVTGLTANTDYTFGVVANCSATEASAYPATVSARTLCDNANLPFVETFEATSDTRNCWTLDAPSTANAISFVTFDGHTAMRFSSYATATDYNQYAYSPVFNTPAEGDSLHVRVRYATYGASDSLWFGFRMANSNDFVWTPTAYMTTGQNDIAYLEATLPINTVQLAIHYYGNYAYYAWIDSVELRVATEVPQVIVYDTTTATACDTYTWHGTAYTTSGVIVDSTSSNDTVFVLNLTVNYSTTGSATVATCDSLVWNGNTYTQSGIFTATLTAANGCDSVVTLNLTVNPSVATSNLLTVCDSYYMNDSLYTASTTIVEHLTTLAGCDSTATLALTVNYSTSHTDSASAVDSYTWHGNNYTVSGVYTDTLTNAAGCDSVCYLNLTVTYTSLVRIDSAEACDSYTWRGTTYTASTVAHDTVANATGADSVYILVLTVNYSQRVLDTVMACDSYLWHGTTYTANTTLVDSLLTTAGCDSIVTLTLTVNHSTTSTEYATATDSYIWHNNIYTVTGIYADTLTNAAGCDSICLLDLTITYTSLVSIDSAEACDSYTWRGTTYTASTVAHDTVTNATGADSVYILVLTVNYSQRVLDTVTACDSYTWNGTVYTASTTVVDSLLTIAGCDSIVTLNLTVNHSTTHTDTASAVDSYIWHGNKYVVSGVYTDTLTNAAGCDSICILDLTVTYSTLVDIDTVAACDSYTWRGTTYTASTVATDTVANATGADSVYILVLTVNYSQQVNDTVMACDSYTWHGNTYTANATAVDSLLTVAGCDSICTLTLTVNHSATGTAFLTGCDSILWNDTWYTSSAIVVDTMETTEGCDSIVAVTLIINQSVTTTETVTICDSYEWNGVTYTASTVDTAVFAAVNGCDSTVVLNLTVNYSVETIDSVLAIDSYTWHGTVYERSTVAHDTLTAFNGCDSIETLVLTLNYSASTIDTIVTCDSATWHGRTYYASIVDRDTLTSGTGADSICLLLLTINYSVTDTFTVSARGQYAWHDSIYTQSGTYYYYGVTQEGCNLTEILILDVDTTQDVYYSVAIVVANTEGQLNVGGTVTGAGSYLAGTEVTLTATPDSGYLFDGWYTRSGLGFGGDLITSDSVYTITIDSNVVLVAMFERIGANSALLTVQVDSTMGYVLFNGERAPFNIFRGTLGETVTLEAIGQDDNCEFLGWVNTMGDTISRDAVYDYLLDQTTTTLTAAFVRHEGIDNVDASNVTIFARENGVVVRGAAQAEVYVFDVVGRLVGHVSAASDEEFIRLPQTGVYLVKVADLPARRVVVRQ